MQFKLEKFIFYELKNHYTIYKNKYSLNDKFSSNFIYFIPNSIAQVNINLPTGLQLVECKSNFQNLFLKFEKNILKVYNQNLQENPSIIFSIIKKFLDKESNDSSIFSSLLKYPSFHNIYEFIDTIFLNSKDKILFFQEFVNKKNNSQNEPNFLLKINLNHLNKFLDQNLTPIQKDDFLLSFFSQNKSNYKRININKIVSEFLFSIYDKKDIRLKPYSEFLSYLKENISPSTLDFFEHFENTMVINLDMEKIISIFGVNEFKVLNSIQKIIKTLCQEENINSQIIKKNNLLTLIFYSKQPTLINKYTIQDILKDFLLKEKNDPSFIITEEIIKSWYLNFNLKNKLTENSFSPKLLKI